MRFKMPPGGIAVICVIVAIMAFYVGGTASLGIDLQNRSWERTEDGFSLSLDFDGSTIDYSMEAYLPFFGQHRQSIATLDYTVIAPGTIAAYLDSWGQWRILSVSISGDTLRISPALTSGDSSELWFRN